MNPVVKGALQGAIPTLVLVGGTNLIVKKFRESKPVFYWGSLAVATGVAIAVVQGRIPAPFMKAETFNAELEDCYVCDGMFKQVYVCDNDCGFQCCEIDIDGNLIPVENADGTVKDYCITCYEEKYGAETSGQWEIGEQLEEAQMDAETFDDSFITTDMSPSYIDVVVTDDIGSSFEGRLYGTMKENHSGAKKGLVSYDPSTGNVIYYHKGMEFVGDVENSDMNYNAKQIRREPQYQFTLDDWPMKIHVENCPMNPHARGGMTYTPKEIAQKSYTILYNHESLPQFEGNTFGELRKASSGLIVPCNCTINEMKVVKELDPATFTREPDETQEHWDAESFNAETFNAPTHYAYYYTISEQGEGDNYDTLEEAQEAVANSDVPMEIYERRVDRLALNPQKDIKLGAETFESESDCREAKEEVKKLRRKIALLDKLYDKENALHHEILGSGGFFKKHELKGLFSEKDLKNYEYWNAETFSAESNLDHRSANLRELQKLLERELSRLAEDNYKIEEQLKKLERGTPKEYPIEIIRGLLSNMHESLGAINGYGMNYLSLLQ